MGYIEPTEAEQAARQQTLQEIAQAVVDSMSLEVARGRRREHWSVWPDGGKPPAAGEAS